MPRSPDRRLIDVSHVIEHGTVTYKGLPAPLICDYLSSGSTAAAGYRLEGADMLEERGEMRRRVWLMVNARENGRSLGIPRGSRVSCAGRCASRPDDPAASLSREVVGWQNSVYRCALR
jgi:hypothetical protein